MRVFKLIALIAFLTAPTFAQIIKDPVDLYRQASIDTYNRNTDKIHQDNLDNYKKFVELDINTIQDDSYNRAKYLSPTVANEVYRTASLNPVVSLIKTLKYDPKNLGIGYCFGRAMFINIDLAFRQFDRDSIKKAFVVGTMQTPDGASWGWHVTTIVQSKDPKTKKEIWLAIDPIAGVKEVTEWYNEMRNEYSTDKKLKLYITTSDRIGTNGSVYEELLKHTEYYNNYFSDMMNWFEEQSKSNNKSYITPVKEYNP